MEFFKNGVTAHRGNSAQLPENTMLAFISAVSIEADWIEADIRQTAEGKLIVLHDDDTKRLANRNLSIKNVTYAELEAVDIAYQFRSTNQLTIEQCPKLPVPLLSDVINLMKSQKLTKSQHFTRLSIHPKVDCIDKVIQLIEDMNAMTWVGFNDSNLRNLKQVKAWNPEISAFWDRPADSDIDDDIEMAREFGVESIIIQHDGITSPKVKSVHSAGLEVGAWTVNDLSTMENLLELGVDRIYTDCPIDLLVIKSQSSPLGENLLNPSQQL
ncbi:TPA: hypothetical protein EYN65_09685 [Candidatus Poribacteria bacterium]|nr:hypothetical protein [Candidatus Poribacteria bacterium]